MRNTIKAVIYGKVKNTAAKAVIKFDKSACEKADLNLDEQVVEKLMIPPIPLTKEAFDMGWDSAPEIQFKSGRCIHQNYECTEGAFKLFEYELVS